MKPLLLILAASLAFAQPPSTINPGSPIASAIVNANFLGLYNGRVGRWSGAGAPGNLAFSLVGDLYYDTTNPGKVYGCYRVHCTAVATNNWVLVSSSGTPGGSTNDFQVNVAGVFTGGRGGLDSSGNATFLGTIMTGSACSGCAGSDDMIAGTPAAVPANSFGWGAPATMTTSQRLISPNAVALAHSLMVIGAPTSNVSSFAYKVVPDCQDSAGNHLNFTQSTDVLSCGTTTSGAAGGTRTIQLPPVGGYNFNTAGLLATWDVFGGTGLGGQGQNGYFYATFANTGTPEMSTSFWLPSDYSSGLTATLLMVDAGSAGNYKYNFSVGCVALGSALPASPFTNTGTTGTLTSTGTSVTAQSAVSLATSGCVAGQAAFLDIRRDNTVGSNVAASVGLVSVKLTYTSTY